MRSSIPQRGRTGVPAAVLEHRGLSPAHRPEWVMEGDYQRGMPADSIAAFQGRVMGRVMGGVTAHLPAGVTLMPGAPGGAALDIPQQPLPCKTD